jgi:hypothetical protein
LAFYLWKNRQSGGKMTCGSTRKKPKQKENTPLNKKGVIL